MFESIKRLMQQEDPNGDWLNSELTTGDLSYMYDTIVTWLEDGLEYTPQIGGYLVWIKEMFGLQ